ncbi:hypothetical protein QQF64_035768 [Cirrhinus molitorella]|uniref:ribonuclease H n=1 Tax=Cirrhinus molitorella TaxID=172907 RepID=A0ABR3NHP6_9TELE
MWRIVILLPSGNMYSLHLTTSQNPPHVTVAELPSTTSLATAFSLVADIVSGGLRHALHTVGRCGHWQYRTLPFGLHGAPATFQHLMDILLRPHQAYAAAYLDDVVIQSEAWEEHLDHLRRVLTELRKAGLTANPQMLSGSVRSEVTRFPGWSGPYPATGQEGGSDPLRTDDQDPGTSFLRVGGVLSLFHPQLFLFSRPSDRSDQEGAAGKDRVDGECGRGIPEGEGGPHFGASAPYFRCPFLLQMDASDTGLGAVLSQVQEGEEHPVLYISRKLTPPERNYAAVEKEALAVKWAVLELRYYLLGRKFTLVTDHAPCSGLPLAKDTNGMDSVAVGVGWREGNVIGKG